MPRRGAAVAGALLLLGVALAAAGCGLGPGSKVGSVDLTVTRDFGATKLVEASGEANESDTVMRFLEKEVEIETRYGGGYVKSIDGLEESNRGGHPYDWFFWVNGVISPGWFMPISAMAKRVAFGMRASVSGTPQWLL